MRALGESATGEIEVMRGAEKEDTFAKAFLVVSYGRTTNRSEVRSREVK